MQNDPQDGPEPMLRSIRPSQRPSRAIVASLDARAVRGTEPKQHGREWLELRRRYRGLLDANARGECSAADVVQQLYYDGLDSHV